MFRVGVCTLRKTALGVARGGRSLCTEKAPRPPKQRGDSEFVKRRRTYRDDIHEMRIRFAAELSSRKDTTATTSGTIEGDQKKTEERRLARKRYAVEQYADMCDYD